MGLFGRNGPLARFGEGNPTIGLAAAQAALNGDLMGMARLRLAAQQDARERQHAALQLRQAQEAALRREQMGNVLGKSRALGGEGFSEGQRVLAMADDENFLSHWNTRYDTVNVNAGDSRVGPGFNYRAPESFRNGNDFVNVDYGDGSGGGRDMVPSGPSGGTPPGGLGMVGAAFPPQLPQSQLPQPQMPQPQAGPGNFPRVSSIPMRTEAEQQAATLQFQPGAAGVAARDRFLRDRYLGSQGPTGAELTREGHDVARYGHDVSRDNNIRSTTTSRENNIRSTTTSRDNNIRSTTQSNTNNVRSTTQSNTNNQRSVAARARGRGRQYREGDIVQNAQGQRLQLRGGQWVPAH